MSVLPEPGVLPACFVARGCEACGQDTRAKGRWTGPQDAADGGGLRLRDTGSVGRGVETGPETTMPGAGAGHRMAWAAGPAQLSAETGTPFSFISVCSSPAWNISMMMSQPPTNSPPT